MAKRNLSQKVTSVSLDNLAGFARVGARSEAALCIPTGYFALDFAIQYGVLPGEYDLEGSTFKKYDPSRSLGIPLGRIIELFGPEGSGKTYMAHRIVSSAQKMGLPCAWIDLEQSYSEDLASINGVNIDELIFSDMRNMEDPDKIYYAEDVMFNIIELIKSGVKVIVLDSVANLIPKARMEAESDQQFMALLARLLSDNLGKIAQWAGVKDALVVFINQIREKPGVTWGNPLTTPGGRALKHNASLRIEINKRFKAESIIFIEDEKSPDGQKLIGRYSYVKLEKNRFAKPLIDTKGRLIDIDIPIYYEPYFPNIEEVVFDAGRQHKVIKVREGTFSWTDKKEKKHQAEGKKAFIEYLKKENLIDQLTEEIKEISESSGIPLPPEMLQCNLAKDKNVKVIKGTDKEVKEEVKK